MDSLGVLEAEELSRRFGATVAVSDVSFSLKRGQALAVFGPNGAGKSTLLRLLAGLLRPDAGRIRLEGGTFDRRDASCRRRLGWISHHTLLYDGLSALENLVFAARLYGLAEPEQAATRALTRFGMADRLHAPVHTLSRGLLQRTALARSMIHAPAVLLLDEPFTGLDLSAATQLRRVLQTEVRSGHTLVLVTHNIEEGYELCSQVAIQRTGRFVELCATESISRDELTARYRALLAS